MTEQRLDETIPGGKYLAADGTSFVDAWGKPIEVKEEKAKEQGDEGVTTLSSMSRGDLESLAVEAGMTETEAKSAKNRAALVEFLEQQSSANSDQDSDRGDDDDKAAQS